MSTPFNILFSLSNSLINYLVETLSFLLGDHAEQLLIRSFSHVQIISQNTSTIVFGFRMIRFFLVLLYL